MENNNLINKPKSKKLLISLASLFLVCCVGLGGIFIWKNWKGQETTEQSSQEENSEEVVNGELVLDEEGMPEDGSDITETKRASDSATLRKLLKSSGKFAIELTDDVRIEETLIVNGTKKLVGSKSIIMELYSKPLQSVLSVAKGATLIMDGITVDANGIADGVIVEKGAGFTGLSGKIIYPVPNGVSVAGVAKLDGIVIERSMDIGVCAQEGANIQINGGKILDSNQTNLHIQATAKVSISGEPIFEGAYYSVRNRGVCEMTGGSLRNASGYLVYNSGEFTVDYQGKNEDDRLEWYGAKGEAGIRTGVGSATYVKGLYLHDIKNKGIAVVNHNEVVMENCVIANTGSYGFSSYNGKKEVVLKDVQILDTKASAVRTNGTVKATLTNITVKNTTGFGVKNENNLVVINNITVENSENTGIWGNTGSETQVDGATIINSGKFGVENNSAKMSLKNVTIKSPKRMGYVGKVDSVSEITKMTIENAPERGIYNLGGKVTASDVTVSSSGTYGVSTAKSQGKAGSLVITNLTVTGVAEKDAANCYESVLEIKKGKLSNAKRHGAIASKGGKLQLTDVEITECGERGVIGSGGDIVLKNVKVTNTGTFGVTVAKTKEFRGSLTAENLTITNVKENALNNNGSIMQVKNGKISNVTGNGAYAENGAELTLTNVEFQDCQKRGIYAKSANTKLTLVDTKIVNAGQSAIFQEAGTTINAENVKVTNAGSYGVFVKSATFTGKDVTVAGTKENGVHVTSSVKEGQSVVKVEKLHVDKAGERGVYNLGGNVTLTNVTITNPGTMGATSAKTDTLVGELVINNLTLTGVTGASNNALNCNGSVLKVIKGSVSNVAGNGAYIENAGQLTLNNVEIKDCQKRGVYVNSADTKAIIKDTSITNVSQSALFQEIGTVVEADGLTVESPGSYGVFVKSAQLDAKNITVNQSVEHSVNISGSVDEGKANVNIEGLTITDAGDRAICNTGGDVILSDVVIKNPATYGATTTKAGEYVGKLDITNLTIEGVLANNALNCNGSVLNVETGTISDVKQNGIYVENGGKSSLKAVEIQGCSRRGIYVNGAGSKLTADAVKVLDTVMTNVRVKNGELVANDLVVTLNDQIGKTVDSETFYGIYLEGADAKVTIDGAKSKVTRTAEDSVTPEKSAIHVETGTMTINNGVYSNLRTKRGGVLYNNGGSVVVNNGTFENNKTTEHGGVIFVEKGSAVINGGTFKNNETSGRGGVLLSKGNINIGGGEFIGNTAAAKEGGGAIGCTGGTTLTVTGGIFQGNKATSKVDKADVYGGGAIESAGKVVISAGTFEANEAQKGGALYIDKAGSLEITGGNFKGNKTNYRGATLYITDNTSKKSSIKGATFDGNIVSNNAGVSGGVMYLGTKADMTIENCTFSNNQAVYTGSSTSTYSYGGVVYMNGAKVVAKNSTFSNNSAIRGGVIYMSQSTSDLTLNNCVCTENVGSGYGKDIFYDTGKLTLSGKVVAQIDKREAAINVTGELQSGSDILVRQISGSKTIIVNFDSAASMNSGKTCMRYEVVNDVHKGKTFTFEDNKAIMK